MLLIKVGLVDTTGTVGQETLAEVAAALNVQVTRDLPQYGARRCHVGLRGGVAPEEVIAAPRPGSRVKNEP